MQDQAASLSITESKMQVALTSVRSLAKVKQGSRTGRHFGLVYSDLVCQPTGGW